MASSALEKIQKLLEKHAEVVEEGRVSKYNEEMTKKDFILPLFDALGWKTADSREVTAEEKVSKKRVDYGFRINGIPKFFLEAKSFKEDLDNRKFIDQAINYAWHKGCTWAILTNFESLKIFNAEVKTEHPWLSQFRPTLHCNEFVAKLDELSLLSREGFEKGLLDKEAEKWGKKAKKIPIDKQLLDDFTHFRDVLSKSITKLNESKNLSEEELDESVQRILDRLIFIRNCEDRELEPQILISNYREWESKGKGHLVRSLRETFVHFDKEYNSKVFATHLCDDLDIDNEVLHEVIEGLYHSYDFSIIDADVLGTIYEQYLSHILKKTEKRAKLTENHLHRKEQGIYYTPTYIVDYIVRNTLGEVLKDKKVDVEKVRVLDPACGSGSFLIKAFDVLNEHYQKDKGYQQTELDLKTGIPFTTKVKILQNNIFGVDLDKQAVEIAQLNLLLKIAEKGHRLPILEKNIKCGNSLIDSETVAGTKAFDWEKEFSNIMAEGGFDVIIGNPPYGAEFIDAEKDFLKTRYKEDQTGNSASFFILRGLEFVKDNGYFSYIVPKQLTYIASWESIRKRLLNYQIVKVIDVSEAFEDVELEQIVFIVKKMKPKDKIIVGFSNKSMIEESTSNSKFFSSERFPLWINEQNHSIFDKILSGSTPLSKLAHVNWGGPVAKYLSKTKTSDSIPCVRGREIRRYRFTSEYFIKKKDIVPAYYIKGEKLLFQRIVSRCGSKIVANYRDARIVGTYSDDDYYADKTVTLIWDSTISLKYLLGLLNSKLISWFAHRYLWNRSQLTMEFMYSYARNFPIPASAKENQIRNMETLVDKMLSLNDRIVSLSDKVTDERRKLEGEIEFIDEAIDKLVYEIYGLTDAEKEIVENSLK